MAASAHGFSSSQISNTTRCSFSDFPQSALRPRLVIHATSRLPCPRSLTRKPQSSGFVAHSAGGVLGCRTVFLYVALFSAWSCKSYKPHLERWRGTCCQRLRSLRRMCVPTMRARRTRCAVLAVPGCTGSKLPRRISRQVEAWLTSWECEELCVYEAGTLQCHTAAALSEGSLQAC